MNSLLHKSVSFGLMLFLTVATATMGWADLPGGHGPEDVGAVHARRDPTETAYCADNADVIVVGKLLVLQAGGSCCACDAAVTSVEPLPFESGTRPVRRAEISRHWPSPPDTRFQPPRS